MYYLTGLNPLRPNSDQHQFSPSDIRRLSRAKSMRINKMITEGKIFDMLSISLNLFFKEMYEISLENLNVDIEA